MSVTPAKRASQAAQIIVGTPVVLAIGAIVLPARSFGNWRKRRQAAKAERQRIAIEQQHIADEREAQYQAELVEMELRWQQHIAKLEDFDRRVNILLTLSCPEGYVACVSKNFDGFISTWYYRITKDGTYIRTRKSDTATVIFNGLEEMKCDLDRYLSMDFALDIPSSVAVD